MKKIKLMMLFLLFPMCALANDLEPTAETTIASIQAYTNVGGGIVLFRLKDSGQVCQGYWLSPTDPGSNSVVAMIIAAHKAKTRVRVWGHTSPEQRWSGSSTHYCKVYTLRDLG